MTDDDLAALVGWHESDARDLVGRDGTPVRLLRPGQLHTMEYVDGRVNLVVDDDERVLRAFRG